MAAVVPGEVGHLDSVEHRQLDRLLRRRRQELRGLVELLYQVDGGEVGTAKLREFPPEGEPGPDPTHQPEIGHRVADVGDRRLRETEPASEFARPGCLAPVLGKKVKDRTRTRDRWREGLAFDSLIDHARDVSHPYSLLAGRESPRPAC